MNIYNLTDKEFKERFEYFINKNNPATDKIEVPETKESLLLQELIKRIKYTQPNFIYYMEALIRYEDNRLRTAKERVEEMKSNFRMFMIPQEGFKREADKLNKRIKELENLLKLTNQRVTDKEEENKRTLDILKSIQDEKKELWSQIPKQTKKEKKIPKEEEQVKY